MNKRKRFTKDVKKKALQALDMLALALANEGHHWSPKERRAYERAVKALA